MPGMKHTVEELLFASLILLILSSMTACGGSPSSAPAGSAPDPLVAAAFTVSPDAAIATGQPEDFTVTGSNYTSASTVYVDGHTLVPNSATATTLEFTIPGELLQTAGTLSVFPYTPGVPANSVPTYNLPVEATGTVSGTNNEQVAAYTMNLPVGSKMRVEFGPDQNYGLVTSYQPAISSGDPVQVLVAGMKPDTTYHMRADILLPDGSTIDGEDHQFNTKGDLAAQFPSFQVQQVGTASPGLEMIDSLYSTTDQAVVTDLSGTPVWYFNTGQKNSFVFPFRIAPDGSIVLVQTAYYDGAAYLIKRIDLAGDTLQEVSVSTIDYELRQKSADFDLAFVDHDLLPLPNGHILLDGSTYKTFSNLPGYPGNTTVTGNVIVDLDQNMQPVWWWNAFDHLDINRHPMLFPDWTHANALLYTKGGNILLSIRHQSWIVKIDYENGKGDGSVLWKLGYQGDFQLAGGNPADWFYAQHGPSIVSQNGSQMTLAVFDDGNDRVMDDAGDVCATGTEPACYSRGVIISLDQNAKTAQVDWAYKPGLYTPWGGNCEVLPNGDVEFDMSDPFPSRTGSEVMEVTQTASPGLVWQMTNAVDFMYRAYRIPSLYPGVQW